MALDELLIDVIIKEYQERKDDWNYAQQKLDSGCKETQWIDVQKISIYYFIVIEHLLKRAGVSLEVLNEKRN